MDYQVDGSYACYWCGVDPGSHEVGAVDLPCSVPDDDNQYISNSSASSCQSAVTASCRSKNGYQPEVDAPGFHERGADGQRPSQRSSSEKRLVTREGWKDTKERALTLRTRLIVAKSPMRRKSILKEMRGVPCRCALKWRATASSRTTFPRGEWVQGEVSSPTTISPKAKANHTVPESSQESPCLSLSSPQTESNRPSPVPDGIERVATTLVLHQQHCIKLFQSVFCLLYCFMLLPVLLIYFTLS